MPPDRRVLDANGAVAPKTFTLGLHGRRSIWRYVVVSRSRERDYGEATVAGGNPTGAFEPTVPFDAAGPTEAGGRPAWVFESQRPIPLLESPAERHRFMLSTREDGAVPAEPVRLPYATSSGTRLMRQDGATRMCSEIYVYL